MARFQQAPSYAAPRSAPLDTPRFRLPSSVFLCWNLLIGFKILPMYGYFSAKEVAALTGVTCRQLAYWVESGIVRAVVDTQGGSRRRRYTFEDLVTVRAVAAFTRAGVKATAVKATADRLRKGLNRPGSVQTLSNTRLVTDGEALFRFEPAVDALVRVDESCQLAFAFECGAELKDLVKKLEARPRRQRYEFKAQKVA